MVTSILIFLAIVFIDHQPMVLTTSKENAISVGRRLFLFITELIGILDPPVSRPKSDLCFTESPEQPIFLFTSDQLILHQDLFIHFLLTHLLHFSELLINPEIHVPNEKDIIKLGNTFYSSVA